MRRGHFEALRPVCPACNLKDGRESPLVIAWVEKEDDDLVIEGALQCPDTECLGEYPIVDGIPLLVPDPRAHIAGRFVEIVAREDLSHNVESMLVECCGPGSNLDAMRQSQGQYAWDHYAEFDPQEDSTQPEPGAVARVLAQALSLLTDGKPTSPILDAGCSVGRTTFELGERSGDLVLGIDTSFSMLRLAMRVLRSGRVRYARRRVGLLADRTEFDVSFPASERVDFWLADATALPFAADTFGTTVALNLIDCVPSPLDLLRSFRRTTRSKGRMLIGSPYDWSGGVTAPEAWIGGHSRRSNGQGRSESILRSLLEPGRHVASLDGVRTIGELDDVPWQVRLHDRSVAQYRLHILAAEVLSPEDG